MLFNDAAFKSSVGGHPLSGQAIVETQFADHTVQKWITPLHVSVQGDPTSKFSKQIDAVFRSIQASTDLEINRDVDEGKNQNFRIIFSDDDDFTINKTENVKCYTQTEQIQGEMTKAEIHINLRENEMVERCIVHEILHGFGLMHTYNLPSAVNYRYNLTHLSKWDRIVLRALYDPSIKAGATRREVLPLARSIISKQMKEAK